MLAEKNFRNILVLLVLLALTAVFCVALVGCSTASSVAFNSDKFVVGIGKEITPDFSVRPKNAEYSFSIGNETIASVTQNGMIKGLKSGITTVTLTSGDKTATATVIVSDVTDTKSVNYGVKKEYTVSFYLSSPFSFLKNEKYREGETITYTVPSYLGYDVDGWFTDAVCTQKYDSTVEKVTSDLTLYCSRTEKENSFLVSNGYLSGLLYPSLPHDELYLPEAVDGTVVRGIAAEAFYSDAKIKKVVIPSSYESIGDFAFAGCTSLETVEIETGSALKTIGKFAFGVPSEENSDGETVPKEKNACTKLTSVVLPNGVEQIGAYAFGYCENLDVNFPTALKTVDYGAFYKTKIKSVNLKNVTEIKAFAFAECANLTTALNTQNVEFCGSNAFYNSGLYNSQINSNPYVAYVGTIVVGCNVGLGRTLAGNGKVTLEGNVTLIADGAFSGKNQSELTVYFNGDNVKIGENAFITDGEGVCLVVPGEYDGEVMKKYIEDNPKYKSLFCTKIVLTITDEETNFGEHTLLQFADGCRYDKYTVLSDPTDPSKKKTPTVIDMTAFGYNVTRINTRAINHFVTQVENNTFTGKMQRLILPENLKSVAVFAVINCGLLEEIDMSACKDVPTIEQNSFQFTSLGTKLTNGKSTYVYVKAADLAVYSSRWQDKGTIVKRLRSK